MLELKLNEERVLRFFFRPQVSNDTLTKNRCSARSNTCAISRLNYIPVKDWLANGSEQLLIGTYVDTFITA